MPFAQDLKAINHLLSTATAEGAYALGAVTGLCEKDGLVASVALMEQALRCETLREALDLYQRFQKERIT